MFEQICNQHDCELVIINQTEDKSFEQELTDDLISLVTVFSARLYGRRSHKNKKIIETLKEELNEKND
jgi:predicted site-specific integrase-resolvase